MCMCCYSKWRRSVGVPLTQGQPCRARLLAAMPGTLAELAQLCGIKYDTVAKTVQRMHKRGLVHIARFEPPEPGPGHRWVGVYVAGPGKDAKVPRWKKRAHSLARCRELAALEFRKESQAVARLYADVFNLTGRRPDVSTQLQD